MIRSVNVTGLQDMINANKKAIGVLDKGTLLDEVGKMIVRGARYVAPRKKGILQAFIRFKKISSEVIQIICDAKNAKGEPYPDFLEFGTRYIPIGTPERPRRYKSSSGKTASLPYLQSAILKAQKKIPKLFEKLVMKYY